MTEKKKMGFHNRRIYSEPKQGRLRILVLKTNTSVRQNITKIYNNINISSSVTTKC